jgi:hypothetical protein
MLLPAVFASVVATGANLAGQRRTYNPDRRGQILSSIFMRLRAAPAARPAVAGTGLSGAANGVTAPRVRERKRNPAIAASAAARQPEAEFDLVSRPADS